jgi:hypothetical protein
MNQCCVRCIRSASARQGGWIDAGSVSRTGQAVRLRLSWVGPSVAAVSTNKPRWRDRDVHGGHRHRVVDAECETALTSQPTGCVVGRAPCQVSACRLGGQPPQRNEGIDATPREDFLYSFKMI